MGPKDVFFDHGTGYLSSGADKKVPDTFMSEGRRRRATPRSVFEERPLARVHQRLGDPLAKAGCVVDRPKSCVSPYLDPPTRDATLPEPRSGRKTLRKTM
ncbi:hypothetical protein Poly21_23720 [Allorhodopirellula heiligendammensis]|uniref:Uncharacterized protein n=2 Tax=Allorhodopirellula heiligendammensis TaxID=2714739 RepID=A0A5C6BWX5_9BACT|nr:hypothetical protein Poly21_23720 [Allorhodopirellula heiligendammensis]